MAQTHHLPDHLTTARDFYMDYEVGKILGDGISSVVRKCTHKDTGEQFAVKIIDKLCKNKGEEVDIKSEVYKEVNALYHLRSHPSVITLVDFYENSAFLFLVFELATGGELFDYLTREVTLAEKICRRLIWQLLQAIKYIHEEGFVHRDMKPENVLLDDQYNVLISDFGFSRKVDEDEKLFEVFGTPSYFAPETLKCVVDDSAQGYGKAVDLWACGVILYTLLVGQGPFWHRHDRIMYRKIMEGTYSFSNPEWEDIGEAPKDLIRKLLTVEPKDRLTAKEALAHPWFEYMVPCPRCCLSTSNDTHTTTLSTPRKKIKLKISLRTLAYTILTLRKLYENYRQQHIPMTYKSLLKEPYTFRNVRKVIDACAFTMYGHWVKRTDSHAQDRDALFENSFKCGSDTSKVEEFYGQDTNDSTFLVGNSFNVLAGYRRTESLLQKE